MNDRPQYARKRICAQWFAAPQHRSRTPAVALWKGGFLTTADKKRALHAHELPHVELLVTLGSPLGLPGDMLNPAPNRGWGSRPPGLARWVNIAGHGDLMAVPRRLGDQFDVDSHHEDHIDASTSTPSATTSAAGSWPLPWRRTSSSIGPFA